MESRTGMFQFIDNMERVLNISNIHVLQLEGLDPLTELAT